LGQWLRSTSNRVDLLTNKIGLLEQAYKDVKKDINVTSMCLFSGPQGHLGFSSRHSWRGGRFHGGDDTTSVAWLATGDAALGAVRRRNSMLKHYRYLSPGVLTLTIPHHGAAKNFHDDLITRIDPTFCVAAADFVRDNWRHPSSEVVRSIASHGAFLFTVTASSMSEFDEVVLIL
jgi:hypothetical protein